MTTSCLFFVLYTCGISKRTIFWSGSSKKAIFFQFDHFSHYMWSSHSGHEYEKGGHMNPMVLYCTIGLWHIKKYIFQVRKLKTMVLFPFDNFQHIMWSSNSGHEHKKGGHMNPMVLCCTITLWHIKTYIFRSGSSKKAIFLKFDHFSHSMWSSNSGHQHEKGGHMNPMFLYCTIDLWHIKIYILLVRKLKKAIFLKFDHFHTPCGYELVMSTKKVVT